MIIPPVSIRLAPDGRHALLAAEHIRHATISALAQTLAGDGYGETAAALQEVSTLTGFELREDPDHYTAQHVRDSQGLHDPHGARTDQAIENVTHHIGEEPPTVILTVDHVDQLIGQLIAVRSQLAFSSSAAPFFEPADPQPAPEQLAVPMPTLNSMTARDPQTRPCPNPTLCTCAAARALQEEYAKPVCMRPDVHTCRPGRRHLPPIVDSALPFAPAPDAPLSPAVHEEPSRVEDLERAVEQERRRAEAFDTHRCPTPEQCRCSSASFLQLDGKLHTVYTPPLAQQGDQAWEEGVDRLLEALRPSADTPPE